MSIQAEDSTPASYQAAHVRHKLKKLLDECEAEGIDRDTAISEMALHVLSLSDERARARRAARHQVVLDQLGHLNEIELLETIRQTRTQAEDFPVHHAATWEWLCRFKGVSKEGVAIVNTRDWDYLFNPVEEVKLAWKPGGYVQDFQVEIRGQSWTRDNTLRRRLVVVVWPNALLGPGEKHPSDLLTSPSGG